MKKIRILLIGSLPPPVGGTSVSFQHLINELHKNNEVQISVINTSYYKHWTSYIALIYTISIAISKVDVVSLHVSSTSLPLFGMIVLLISRMQRKPFIVRKFGGVDIHTFSNIKRKLGLWVLKKSNLYLAQTKELVETANLSGIKNVHWYPTSRPNNNIIKRKRQESVKCNKFVYLGAIRSEKGIYEIIKAGSKFEESKVTIDFYGNTDYDISIDELQNLKNIFYKGNYNPENVYQILHKYDVLVLPSYYHGEGYPGVIIEAFQMGLPVICTNWKALPELVNENCGILIEPQNYQKLYEAMRTFMMNDNYYRKLYIGAKERGQYFSSEVWAAKFIKYCQSLITE